MLADAQEFVLRRMPYLISEPLRKLLAPSDSSNQIFYDTPSEERVKMLLYAYRSLICFMSFSLLGQLWKEKLRQEELNLTTLTEVLKKWMLADSKQESQHSLLSLYQQLVQFLNANNIPFFFDELAEVLRQFENTEMKDSIIYLEGKLASAKNKNEENISWLCDELEQHLAIVLYSYGFLVHYSLTSVKDIEVLFYMHQPEAEYAHKVVRLQQQVTALEDGIETINTYYKTASILLRSMKNKTRSLYLSPFLIDENAYTKTTKANLRYFSSFDRTNKQFKFKQVSKPEDVLSVEKKYLSPLAKIKGEKSNENDFYQLINAQFGAFCETVLGQTLDT